jgi:ribosomal protein S18 acetylase RimI-like enzyme
MVLTTFRSANLGDARAIAKLHVTAWRHAYQALAPADAYAALDEHRRFTTWHDRLVAPCKHQLVLLAERNGVLAGFGVAGAPSHKVFGERGEIKFLYLGPTCKRQGIGSGLLAELARHLMDHRYCGAALGVVEGNEPAIAFYKALGARRIGSFTDPGPLWRSHNLVFAWDDLTPLVRSGR